MWINCMQMIHMKSQAKLGNETTQKVPCKICIIVNFQILDCALLLHENNNSSYWV